LEAQVGAGGVEAFVQGAVVGGELADTLLEGGVLGGDALDRVLGPFGFQVADAAEQLADPCPLGDDSWLAVLSACSALSVRSRQLAASASSCLSWRRSRWAAVSRMALATAVFASELV